MPRSKNSKPGLAPERAGKAGVELLPAPDLAAGLFEDNAPALSAAGGNGPASLEVPEEPLIAFDVPDELEFTEEMSKVDLKSYWIKAIQDMSDEEIADFDMKARGLAPKGIRPLPRKAPKLWRDAKEEDPTLDPPTFLQKFWGDWLDGVSFHRGEFRDFDPGGEKALQNWLHANGNTWPHGVYLPTKSEALDRRDVGSVRAARRVMMRVHRSKV